MYCQDLEFEELVVSEPIALPLHGFDLVVGSFKGTCANRVVVVGQEAGTMCIQRLGHLEKHVDSRRLRASDTVVEKQSGVVPARLLPELSEVLLHVVGQRQGLIQPQSLLQARSLVPL